MKNKKLILVLVILLVIGFASISTTLVLNGVIGVGANKDDFNVIFTEALLDGESANVTISENKKNISFITKKLTTIGDSTILNYKVKNTSTQYDANVIINCTNNAEEYIELTSSFDNKDIPLVEPVKMVAQEVKSGYINAELIKSYAGEDKEIKVSCSLIVNAESKEGYSYTVNFDSDGGSSVSDKIVNYQGTYGELPTPEKEGYIFLGWYDENDQKIESASVIDAKGNKTLHAKWEPVCLYEVGKTWDFNYTGGEQTFYVPCEGEYKLEVWGAQGGNAGGYTGGYGGYSKGEVQLKKKDTLFIDIGGSGNVCNSANSTCAGGFNGGGSGKAYTESVSKAAGGGGATHIATKTGLLMYLSSSKSDILIVAGGGGGGHYTNNVNGGLGGHGGGVNGMGPTGLLEHNYANTLRYGSGSSQYNAGCTKSNTDCGGFGYGGNSNYANQHDRSGSGGGGGYYGGSGANIGPGGGGSGYIGNSLLTNKIMYCYNCSVSNEESTKTISTTNVNASAISNYAKAGNGYAKLTLLSISY